MKINCGEYNLKKNIKFLNQNETIIIDPGIVNLCISYPKQKRVWLFHFENIYDLLRNEEFKSVFKQFETIQNLNIICENQFLSEKDINDDTIVLRGIAGKYIFHIDKDFDAIYFPRTSFVSFLKHAFHRGKMFVSGYLMNLSRVSLGIGVLAIPVFVFFAIVLYTCCLSRTQSNVLILS